MDAVVELGQARMGFEVKCSSAPKVTKGFWQAREDLQLAHTCIVAPVTEGWPVQEGVSEMALAEIPAALARLGLRHCCRWLAGRSELIRQLCGSNAAGAVIGSDLLTDCRRPIAVTWLS
jgi:hypothetical protein